MPQENAIQVLPVGFEEDAASSAKKRSHSGLSLAGDHLNRVLVDSTAFASVSAGLFSAWWLVASVGSGGQWSVPAGQPAEYLLVAIVIVALSLVLIARRHLTLGAHASSATWIGGAGFTGWCLLNVPGADEGVLGAALVAALVAGACRLLVGCVVERKRRCGNLRRRVAIYGATRESADCFMQLAEDRDTVLVGLFDERESFSRLRRFGIDPSGQLADLKAAVARGSVDELIIALPATARGRAQAIVAQLSAFPLNVRWSACLGGYASDVRFRLSRLGRVELADVQTRPLESWGLVFKQVQDKVGGLILFAGFLPIMALIAVAIKLDSRGPVFFRQRRHGIGGRTITVWKFRSMRVLEDGERVVQARANDQRVTRVGRLLRRSSLDELPQLINVLRGEMSLVGPRPHAIAHNDYYAQRIRAYNARNKIKPGITGWAQVNGYRGETNTPEDMEQRVAHDHWYIRNWSVWLDVKILLLTPIFGLFHRNAY